jgi:hypothetical protein
MLSAIGAWAIALFPWNPAVWFIVKRLRLSIEIDCDRRVLARRRANARDYGILLLTVGARTGNDLRFAVSLAEPRRFLEQRILAMTSARPSRPLIASAPFVGIALLAAVAMAQTPRPESTLVVRRPPTPPAATPTRSSVKIAAPQSVVPPVLERVEDQPSRQPPRVVAPTPPRSSEGLIPIAPAPRTTQPIPIDVVRAWIQARHPNVIAGDPHVNAVTIVVDENNSLLASVTDSLETEERRKGPSIVVDGRLIGTYEEAIHTPTPRPVIVVDGVRIDSTTQLDTIPIESIDVLKGKSAAAEYGPDAQNGIVIIRSMRPNDAQLRRLGVSPNNIAQMTELRLRPGVIGPNRLYVAVLQLKKY